ncbi:MAG: hypothetical protein CSB13_09925 [Chloroflexi bacterium]|nr:MAG: hypothetical protein CSB13_09925 [Chloroflexota bacterium]
MGTVTVKVKIDEMIYADLNQMAEASTWSLNDVLAQTIKAGLPPSLTKVPAAFHRELLSLNSLNDRDLMKVADGNWPVPKMDETYQKADFLTLRRTYAMSVLRWRGHPVPNLYEFG